MYFYKKNEHKRKRLRPSKIKMKSAVLGLLLEIADTKRDPRVKRVVLL
jgi:hypothetical protein